MRLLAVLVIILFNVAPVAAQEVNWTARDPLASEHFRIMAPEGMPFQVHATKQNSMGIWTMRWSNITQKRVIGIEWRHIRFSACRSLFGVERWDEHFLDYDNRVKNQANQYWHDFSFPGTYNERLSYYNYLVPEKVLFDDFTVWERKDNSIFIEIATKMGVLVNLFVEPEKKPGEAEKPAEEPPPGC